jgi:hypothetical protein
LVPGRLRRFFRSGEGAIPVALGTRANLLKIKILERPLGCSRIALRPEAGFEVCSKRDKGLADRRRRRQKLSYSLRLRCRQSGSSGAVSRPAAGFGGFGRSEMKVITRCRRQAAKLLSSTGKRAEGVGARKSTGSVEYPVGIGNQGSRAKVARKGSPSCLWASGCGLFSCGGKGGKSGDRPV